MTSLLEQLARLEAEANQIRREIAGASCAEVGHIWKHIGGKNAGCGRDCGCSVPVHVCTRCEDCDYGDTEEADQHRAACAEIRAGR